MLRRPERGASLRRTVAGQQAEKQLLARCECGFETQGTLSEVYAVLSKHAREAHNMKVTRAAVAARAKPI
jgi:hypothetical protein